MSQAGSHRAKSQARLRARIAAVRRRRSSVDLQPGTAYEAITREMVNQLRRDLDSQGVRLWGLVAVVVGAVLVNIALRLVGI